MVGELALVRSCRDRLCGVTDNLLHSILGSVIIAVNGPSEQGSTTIQAFQAKFVSVGFLVWGGICIAAALGMMCVPLHSPFVLEKS